MKLQRKNRLRALSLGAVAVSGALALTACGSDDTGGGSGDTSAPAANGAIKCDDAKGELLAAGSSAQKNAIDAWVKQYTAACKDVRINYKPERLRRRYHQLPPGPDRLRRFGLRAEARGDHQVRQKVCKGGQAIDLPMVGGPIAVGYNLPGVDDLVLDAPTLAKIFDDKIKTWNDAAIKKLNPDAKLPEHQDPDVPPLGRLRHHGQLHQVPEGRRRRGLEVRGRQGLAGQGRPVRLGFLRSRPAGEPDRRRDLLHGAVVRQGRPQDGPRQDRCGHAPVEATVDNATKAIAEAKVVGKGKDLALELNYTPKAEGAYPITLVTYEIACDKGNKAETLAATKSFLHLPRQRGGPGRPQGRRATPRCPTRSSPRSARPSPA